MIISPSPPPPSSPPTTQLSPAQPPMQGTDPNSPDPRIASLKAIFPDFDDAVILSVLESAHDDSDRALDVLLGMNDPLFVPPNPPPAQAPSQSQPAPSVDAQRLSQEALDEQLARRLALEEQNAASQVWQPQAVQGQTAYQPYQARRGGRNEWGVPPQGPPQTTQGQGGRDTMAEFQDGFNRIAESGKKTFSSIFSKVKAKVQEFDQGSGWSWTQNSPPAGQASQPVSGSYYTPDQPVQGVYAQPYHQPTNLQRQTSQSQPTPVSTYTSSPPRSGISGPPVTDPIQPATAQQPSYYDPNSTRGYDLYGDDEDEIELHDRRTSSSVPAPAATQSPPTTTTTTTTPLPEHPDSSASPPPPSDTSSPPSYASPVSSPPPTANVPGPVSTGMNPPARAGTFPSTMATTAGSRGTKPGAPGGVDFSKLGLLPKRPVSLVRSQSPSTTAGAGAGAAGTVSGPRVAIAHSTSTTDSATDYEEAEFLENPFEDR